jgi:hypothetical protein
LSDHKLLPSCDTDEPRLIALPAAEFNPRVLRMGSASIAVRTSRRLVAIGMCLLDGKIPGALLVESA